MDKKKEADIDYMHPDGKPERSNEDPEDGFDGRELEAESKRKRSAEIDADGHHMCSSTCQKHHRTKV